MCEDNPIKRPAHSLGPASGPEFTVNAEAPFLRLYVFCGFLFFLFFESDKIVCDRKCTCARALTSKNGRSNFFHRAATTS